MVDAPLTLGVFFFLHLFLLFELKCSFRSVLTARPPATAVIPRPVHKHPQGTAVVTSARERS